MLVYTVNRQAVEHIERSHPLGVTLGKVVVDCHDMDTFPGESVEEYRKRSHKRLSLSRGHFGYLTLMQDYTADELDIVMHHVPCDLVAAGHPVVVPYGIIPIYLHEIPDSTQVTVEISGPDADDGILLEPPRSGLHHRKCLRKNLVEHILYLLIYFLHKPVRLRGKLLFLIERNVLVQLRLYVGNPGLIRCSPLPDTLPEFLRFGTELIIRKPVYLGICSQHLVEDRSELFEVTLGLGAENLLENIGK